MSYSLSSIEYNGNPTMIDTHSFSGQLSYYNPIVKDEVIYSCDRVMLVCSVNKVFAESIRSDSDGFKKMIHHATTLGTNGTLNQYYQTYYANYGESTVTFKLLLNSVSNPYQCTVEVNPNKCFGDSRCICDLMKFLSQCTEFHFRVIDVAIDFSKQRSLFRMEKDRRKKMIVQSSKINSTEYCGKRNNPGYCKLYDKCEESGLSNQCTRIEVTYGNPLDDKFEKNLSLKLPVIMMKKVAGLLINDQPKLSSTDQVLVEFFITSKDEHQKSKLFKMLDYKKQKRLSNIVYSNEERVEFDVQTIRNVIGNILGEFIPEQFFVDGKKIINRNEDH